MGLKASSFTATGNNTYIKSDDVKQGPQKFTIKSVEATETPEGKPALQLVMENDRKLTLNKTNARILAGLLGDDTDTWLGKKIVASFDPTVMYSGKMVGGIRVRPVQSASATGLASAQAASDAALDGDDLGF